MSTTIQHNEKTNPQLKGRKFSGVFSTIWVIGLLAVFMIQCKKDTYEGETFGDCPEVVSTDPANENTDIFTNTVISVTFNGEMNPATLDASTFIVEHAAEKSEAANVSGTFSYSENTSTFTPAAALSENTTYTGTITTGAKDMAGYSLAENYVWSFTTGTLPDVNLPTLTSTDPEDLADNIALTKTISASFSESMDPASVDGSTFTLFQDTINIEGVVTYSELSAIFNPNDDLLPGTEYTATITNAVKDLAGNQMELDYTWTFTTESDEVLPSVILTDPLEAATNVFINKTITAEFSEILDNTTVTQTSFTLMQGTVSIDGAVSYAGITASFNPDVNLLPDTEYTATLTTDILDLAGNAMTNEYSWTFTTGILMEEQQIVILGSAGDFVILAGSGVTNTGNTIITGDVGTDPTGTVDGFPPGIIYGDIHAADVVAAEAKLDLTTAYNDAQGRSTASISLPGDLSGLTLVPGLYTNSTSVMLSAGNVTLDAQGDENAVFIFQMGSTLTTESGTGVILTGGAKAENIYWAVGSSATLGTNSIFYGNILADQSISLNTGATLNGRALTRIGAVTLDASIVTKP